MIVIGICPACFEKGMGLYVSFWMEGDFFKEGKGCKKGKRCMFVRVCFTRG